MPRYIDADELYKATQKRIAEANEARMAVVDDEFLDLIDDAFTEDVAPKSEVERHEKEILRLMRILNSYALQYGTVTDQQDVIDKAKSEIAREIFEEIEKHMVILGDDTLTSYFRGIGWKVFAELKKKYTGDQNNGTDHTTHD